MYPADDPKNTLQIIGDTVAHHNEGLDYFQ